MSKVNKCYPFLHFSECSSGVDPVDHSRYLNQIPGINIFPRPYNRDGESCAGSLMVCRVSFQELISEIATDLSL